MNIKNWCRKHLPRSIYEHLVLIAKTMLGWWYRNDLNRLAGLFRTDKWGSHWYTQHYQRYFAPLKNKPLNVLEIGVGGYAWSDLVDTR